MTDTPDTTVEPPVGQSVLDKLIAQRLKLEDPNRRTKLRIPGLPGISVQYKYLPPEVRSKISDAVSRAEDAQERIAATVDFLVTAATGIYVESGADWVQVSPAFNEQTAQLFKLDVPTQAEGGTARDCAFAMFASNDIATGQTFRKLVDWMGNEQPLNDAQFVGE